MLFASEIKHPVATIYDLPVTVDTFDAGVAIAEIDAILTLHGANRS